MNIAEKLLKETNALMEGHFLLSSGKHSDKYFQCAKLLQYPDKACAALETAARAVKDDISEGKIKIDLTAGPAMGGIIAAWELGRQLGIPSLFTERDAEGKMALRRGFEIKKGSYILIVEDVVTTGKSSMECAAALEEAGGIIAGLACIVDRRNPEAEKIPWPFYPAVRLEADTFDACDCELCKRGIPFIKPGSRK